MFTISHDYYAILGVVKDATLEEIKGQYKTLQRKNHPDKYKGQRAKYAALGDEDLLETIDEKILQAEEFCKLLNEAFEVLSDPVKRRQYDNETVEPKIEEPKIIISPKSISFGTLKDGEKKHSIFTIKNDGGPATSVNIDWEGDKPDWGDLVIEPDENSTFPIKVAISVNTTGISSGVKDGKIVVTVDGRVQTVEVFLSIAKTVIPDPSKYVPGSTIPGSGRKPISKWPLGIAALLCIGCLVFIAIQTSISKEENTKRQNARATQTVDFILSDPKQALSIVRVANRIQKPGCSSDCSTNKFEITNNSTIELVLYNSGSAAAGSGYCESSFGQGISQRLDPGSSTTIYCVEDPPAGVCLEAEYQFGKTIGEWCLDHTTANFLTDKDYYVAATAEADRGIQTEFSVGECNFNCGYTGVGLSGTLKNNSGKKIISIRDGAETPQGVALCSFSEYRGGISDGQSTKFVCFGYGYDITQSKSICFGVNYEDNWHNDVCKDIIWK